MNLIRNTIATLCFIIFLTPVVISNETEYVTQETYAGAGVTKELIDICKEVKDTDIEVEQLDIPIAAVPIEESIVEEITYESEPEYIQINSTAFCDSVLADGTDPHYGVLAGKREWLGKSVELYDLEYNYIGYFTFHDIGYGRPTGYGESELLDGRSLGDIETGEVIDIWLSSEYECERYGRKDIYMVWVE